MMKQALIRFLVRWRFRLTSRHNADALIQRELDHYLKLAEQLSEDAGRQQAKVPAMTGVDEDMRDWSFYMILEHNVIVNRAMQNMVTHLAQEEIPENRIDPKRDVMPSSQAGPEQVDAFRESVASYQSAVAPLTLEGVTTYPHPIFRHLNAHGWYCVMGLHLQIHWRQAEALLPLVKPA